MVASEDPGGMTEPLHTHETIGFKPKGKCPACDLTRADLARSKKNLVLVG